MTDQPNDSETLLPSPLGRQVNEVCDRFEAQWKAATQTGRRPRIEDFLVDALPSQRGPLLRELVLMDVDYRRLAGEQPCIEDYGPRFRELEEPWLRAALRQASDGAADAATVVQTDSRGGPEETQTMPAAVGGYRLRRRLGGGGMGTVFEAEEAASGRRVAVKFLAPELADSADAIARFRAEGRLASAIAHPRCVFVLAADEDAGRPYIVMELMPGDTLADLVKRNGPLPPQQAVAHILDVIEGLQEAHRAGVIHRDVKPSNCFLSGDGRVKIGDFGLSKSLTTSAHVTRSGTFLGTPLFASPEQIKAQPVDARTDVYSVAATLYYLLAGKAPFEGGDGVAVMARIVSDPPPPLRTLRPEISPGLERVVLRGLERDRERRPQTLQELRALLLPFSPEHAAAARPAWRFGAHMLDGLFFFLFSADSALFAVLISWGFIAREDIGATKQIYFLVWNGVWILYFTVLEGLWGWSLGKLIFGLRVCAVGGSDPPGLARALVRTTVQFMIVYLVGTIFQYFVYASPDDWRLWIGAIAPTILGALLLLTTMRRANGYRAPHDLLCGTSVMLLPSAEASTSARAVPSRFVPTPGLPPDVPERLGPFALEGTLYSRPDQKLLAGTDPALGRAVWVVLQDKTAAPLTSVRRDLHRPGRLRWLAGGTQGAWQWDAFLAPAGVPAADFVSRGPLAWYQSRPILEQLAEELAAARADGTLPHDLTPDQVWVREGGTVLLLDTPPGEPSDPSPTRKQVPDHLLPLRAPVGRSNQDPVLLELLCQVAIILLDRGGPVPGAVPRLKVRLLLWGLILGLAGAAVVVFHRAPGLAVLLLAAAGLGGAIFVVRTLRAKLVAARAGLIRAPLPGHADDLLARLLGARQPYTTLDEFRADLDATRDRPARVTAKLRLAHLATLGTLLLPSLFMMVLFSRSASAEKVPVLNEKIAAAEKALRIVDEGKFRDLVYADMGQKSVRKVAVSGAPGFMELKRDQILDRFSDPQVRRKLADMVEQLRRDLELRLGNLGFLEEYVSHHLENSKRLLSAGHVVDLGKFDLGDFLRSAHDADNVDRIGEDIAIGALCLVLVWPACWMLWSFFWRGGLTHRFLGLALVLPSGHRALRLQCAWRTLVVWLPVAILAALTVWLEAFEPEWEPWSWLCWGVAFLWLSFFVLLALRWPSRGLHDRLAGTYLVPR